MAANSITVMKSKDTGEQNTKDKAASCPAVSNPGMSS